LTLNQQDLASALSGRYEISPEYRSRYLAENGLLENSARDLDSFLSDLSETQRLRIDYALSPNRRGEAARRDEVANMGAHTRFFVDRVMASGKVIAIEPDRENDHRLVQATAPLPTVTAMQVAASVETGPKILNVSGNQNVDHQTFGSVAAYRIDDAVAARSHACVIGMDIQGADSIAMRGPQHMLTGNPGIPLRFEYRSDGTRRSGDDAATHLTQFHAFELVPAGDLPERGNDAHCSILAHRLTH